MVANRESIGVEFEQAQREFASISQSLQTSYAALAERADFVEEELCRMNTELATKVEELDRVTGDLEAVLAALPTGVVVRDPEGRIVRANPAAQRILGTPQDELLGLTTHPLLSPTDGPEQERELVREDGVRLVLASRLSEIEPDGGSVEILDDRTEVAVLNERLHRMDKVAALGTMAGGIAHEIRNPLNAVAGFAKLLTGEFDEGTKAHRWASLIFEGADEANSIITSLLCIAGPQHLATCPIDPGELLEQAVRAARNEDDDSAARWQVHVNSTAPPYLGDRIKLRQAVRNLVANAIDAQPDGGEVEVHQSREREEIVIRVSDAGPGIPKEIRGLITDPFFTTRAEGTGLGLALTSTIAQVHGGSLEISPGASSLGGAELSLRIPFSPASS